MGKKLTEVQMDDVHKVMINLCKELGLDSPLSACKGVREVRKSNMKLNDACPHITVDPQTYEVHADGELLTCEPATELPLAQRYHLF